MTARPDLDLRSPDEERLLQVAVDIADGAPIDWEAVSSSVLPSSGFVEPPHARGMVQRLRHVERLVQGHEAFRSRLTRIEPAGAHETLLTEARRTQVEPGNTQAPVRWGPLDVLEKVGRGSFGDVYRAWDPRLDREVALKLIPESVSEAASSPVIEEGRLLARVRHPNVLTVHGADRVGGRVGIWTEFVRGETLVQEVARRGPLPAAEVAWIGAEVCAALTAVHDAGLLHRDVKAQNVLRDETGRITLGDFGTGIALRDDGGSEQRIAGTPLYLAPELFDGVPATRQSDLYSVGVLLYFLATTAFPVRGHSFGVIKRAHATMQRVTLREAGPDLPTGFVSIVERLLAVGPAQRFESAAAAEAALRAWIEPKKVARDDRVRITGVRPSIALIALACTVLIAIAGLVAWRTSDRIPTERREVPSASTHALPADASSSSTMPSAPPGMPSAATLNFGARDWVVIAQFENRTGDSLLDGTLEFALGGELSNSAFVNVVPRDRVEDALELMRRPTDTKLTVRVAREVALRDGAIRAIVDGRVEKMGATYVITSQIVNPADGGVVASLSEEARGSSELLSATRRQAFRLREALGEMLRSVRESEAALEKVTTPSLHAAQLYSQAMAFLRGDASFKPGPAEQLLRQAVAIDPEFASAHILLAWAIHVQGRPSEEYLNPAKRALDLANQGSDGERYFIIGTSHLLQARASLLSGIADAGDESRKAAAAFEALLGVKPDHFLGVAFLGLVYNQLRQEPQATEMLARRADLQPMNVPLRWALVQRLFGRGEIDRGWTELRRVRRLLTPAFANSHPEYLIPIQQLEVAEAWLRRDVVRVRLLADDLAHRMESGGFDPQTRPGIGINLLGIYQSLGRLHDARRVAEGLPAGRREQSIVQVLSTEVVHGKPGAKEALEEYLTRLYPGLDGVPANPLFSLALIQIGRVDALRAAVATAKRDGYVPYYQQKVRWFALAAEGRLALAEGRIEEAALLYERSVEAGGPTNEDSQGVVLAFAKAWVDRGDVDRAMTMLEAAAGRMWSNSAVASSYSGFGVRVGGWIFMRAYQADLYRKAGQSREATAIEAELLQLLAVADDDNPLAVRLKARQGRASAP